MTRYLDLAEYLWLSEQFPAYPPTCSRGPAGSTSPTPRCTLPWPVGDEDFYPDIADKAAVLC